jgi:uncharacterized lipoprotein YehR (DUF1307 family)
MISPLKLLFDSLQKWIHNESGRLLFLGAILMRKKFACFVCFMIILTLAGCGTVIENAPTEETFNVLMEANGFTVTEGESAFPIDDDGETLASLRIARKEDVAIQYCRIRDAKSLKIYYDRILNSLHEPGQKTSGGTMTGGGIVETKLTVGDNYFVLTQIDKTLIFASTVVDNKKEITALLKELSEQSEGSAGDGENHGGRDPASFWDVFAIYGGLLIGLGGVCVGLYFAGFFRYVAGKIRGSRNRKNKRTEP